MKTFKRLKTIFIALLIVLMGCGKEEQEIFEEELGLDKDDLVIADRIEFIKSTQIPEAVFYETLYDRFELDRTKSIPQPPKNSLELVTSGSGEIALISKNYLNEKISVKTSALALVTASPFFTELDEISRDKLVAEISNSAEFDNIVSGLENLETLNWMGGNEIQNLIAYRRQVLNIPELDSIQSDKSSVAFAKSNNKVSKNLPYEINYNNDEIVIESKVPYHLYVKYYLNSEFVDDGLLQPKETITIKNIEQNSIHRFDFGYIGTPAQFEDVVVMYGSLAGFVLDFIGVDLGCRGFILEQLESKLNLINLLRESDNNSRQVAFKIITALVDEVFIDTIGAADACLDIKSKFFTQFKLLSNAWKVVDDLGGVFFKYPFYENISSHCVFNQNGSLVDCQSVTVLPPFNPLPTNGAANVSATGNIAFTPGSNTPQDATFELYYGINTTPIEKVELNTNTWSYAFPEEVTVNWKVHTVNKEGTYAISDTWSFTTAAGNTKPSITTKAITNKTQTSATTGGEIASNGGAEITEKGVLWGTSPNLNTNSNKKVAGSGDADFTVPIDNLTPNTLYYVKAYATNAEGTGYGDILTFTTSPEEEAVPPSVETKQVTNITSSSAVFNGVVTTDNGWIVTHKGFVWSSNPSPDMEDNVINVGAGASAFGKTISDLLPNTNYYVKAFGTNAGGTTYGEEIEFKTLQEQNSEPIVVTRTPSNITANSAVVGGDVQSEGSSTVVEKGVVWSINNTPTINDNKQVSGQGLGVFTLTINNLNASTQYFVASYAINNEGVFYGDVQSFVTQQATSGFSDVSIEDVYFEEENDGSWEINVELKNIGDTATPDGEDINIVYVVNGEVIGDDKENQLEPNETGREKLDNYTFPRNGNNTVSVVVGEVSNENEFGNNIFVTNFFNEDGGTSVTPITPSDLCSIPVIMDVETEYEVTLSAQEYANNYTKAESLEGESAGGGRVRGFWLAVQVPNGFYARNIKVYDVSSGFDPVIALRSNCNLDYYPNLNANGVTANDNGKGGVEVFKTGISGPDNQGDGIYHIRIYHYNGNENPSVNFKIMVD